MPSTAPAAIRAAQHWDTFRRLTADARRLAAWGRLHAAVVVAELAATHATWRHPGLFASAELERMLVGLSRQLGPRLPGSPVRCPPRHVLHVASHVWGIDGLNRHLRRWIESDAGRVHSLAVTWHDAARVPADIAAAVAGRGGRLTCLDALPTAARARALRRLALDADTVVLHVETSDATPLLAFGDGPRPPTILVNHADNVFWLGVAVADAVASLRESGLRLAHERRGVARDRNLLLPTILPERVRTLTREEAKRRLDLDPGALVLLSIARCAKYAPLAAFIDAHRPILARHPRAVLVMIGPGGDEAASLCARVRVLPARADTEAFYQAADVYVDSFPVPSITSLLEAGAFGVPVVTRCAHSPRAATLCADAPGLGEVMRVTRTPEEYQKALDELLEDAGERARRGAVAAGRIAALHGTTAWRAAVERCYARAASLPPATAPVVEDRRLDDVDLALPDVYRADDFAATVERHADRLSVALRIRTVARLGLDRPGLLLPPWLGRRLVGAGLGRPLARGLNRLRAGRTA
jgi:glycosyltransferase involved in cell wall biosynthesis